MRTRAGRSHHAHRACDRPAQAALASDVPHPNAVRLALERARERRGQSPPVALVLSEHVARRDAPVRSHALASYDRLKESDDERTGDEGAGDD